MYTRRVVVTSGLSPIGIPCRLVHLVFGFFLRIRLLQEFPDWQLAAESSLDVNWVALLYEVGLVGAGSVDRGCLNSLLAAAREERGGSENRRKGDHGEL